MSIAVLVPCLNEEKTIAGVVESFRNALPDARCYVYDNASTDRTADEARAAGAIVRSEPVKGQGSVIRRMFADVEADVYVMVDGDGTYEAAAAPAMVERLVAGNLDMVLGARVPVEGENPHRRWHKFGNAFLNRLINALFGGKFTDCYSGYRVMSRRLVKSFPTMSQRFEPDLQMAAHCAYLHLSYEERPTRFVERPAGSESKLRTFRDGAIALFAIWLMLQEARPLPLFSLMSLALGLIALVAGFPIIATERSLASLLPEAALCGGLGIAATGCFFTGLILDGVSRGRRESKRLAYLRHPSVQEALRSDEGRP